MARRTNGGHRLTAGAAAVVLLAGLAGSGAPGDAGAPIPLLE